MPITVGSNIASLRAQRELAGGAALLGKSLERLSTGQRINKASDDAAGLAIADQLRADVRLASAATRNVNDGLSASNILTGALDSQKQVLFRMAELAEQSANGTYSKQQRTALNEEYQALMLEFDRIASTTTFNGVNLLRDPEQSTLHIMAGITGADSSLLELTRANSHRFAGLVGQRSDVNGSGGVNLGGDYLTAVNGLKESNIDGLIAAGNRLQDFARIDFTDSAGVKGRLNLLISRIFQDNDLFTPVPVDPPATMHYLAYATRSDGDTATIQGDIGSVSDALSFSFNWATSGVSASVGLDLSGIGYQSLDAGVPIKQTAIGFTNIINPYFARSALDTVTNRIEVLSALQGRYGALQARLTSTESLLSASIENMASAESRIRDSDIAAESSSLLRSQILQQAGTAVLAQANQQPGLALQLLAGG